MNPFIILAAVAYLVPTILGFILFWCVIFTSDMIENSRTTHIFMAWVFFWPILCLVIAVRGLALALGEI